MSAWRSKAAAAALAVLGLGGALTAVPATAAAAPHPCRVSSITWEAATFACAPSNKLAYGTVQCLGWWLSDGLGTHVGVYEYRHYVYNGDRLTCSSPGFARVGIVLNAWPS